VIAAKQVLTANPEAGFVIFGEGPLREELHLQIAAAGLDARVVLPGFRDDLDQWLAVLDLFVQSSFTEGLPNVVLEALAARIPVVATAVGGTPEVVADGVNGYLVPPGDAAALARRILALLADDQLRRRMGQQGFARVQRDFTFAAQAEQYRRLLARLLQPRNGQTRREPLILQT
jgi:glycosyltransferase involved in cell wall biosynthesis